jgi:protein TonB
VEVPVQAQIAPVIATTTSEPPPPAEPAPPPKPAVPAVVDIAVTCPNHVAVRSQVAYPPQAERLGLSGDVVVDFIVAPDGSIKNIGVVRSSNPVFNNAATGAVAKLRCAGQSQDVRVRVPFSFRLDG